MFHTESWHQVKPDGCISTYCTVCMGKCPGNQLYWQALFVQLNSANPSKSVTQTAQLMCHKLLTLPQLPPRQREVGFRVRAVSKDHSIWIIWVEGTFLRQLKRLKIAKRVNVFKKLRLSDKTWCVPLRLRGRRARQAEGNTWTLANVVSTGCSGLGYTFTLTASLFPAAGKPSIKWQLPFSSH